MSQKNQPTEESGPRMVVYPGPFPQITIRNLPELGEITLDRGKPFELPAAIAADLIKRKKVNASRAAASTEPQS